MLPVIAHNLLRVDRTAGERRRALLADTAIAGFTVRGERLREALDRNPILVTALNPVIGYEKAAAIAKQAYREGRPVLDVAREVTGLPEKTLRALLDPAALAKGGIHGKPAAGGGRGDRERTACSGGAGTLLQRASGAGSRPKRQVDRAAHVAVADVAAADAAHGQAFADVADRGVARTHRANAHAPSTPVTTRSPEPIDSTRRLRPTVWMATSPEPMSPTVASPRTPRASRSPEPTDTTSSVPLSKAATSPEPTFSRNTPVAPRTSASPEPTSRRTFGCPEIRASPEPTRTS